MTNDYNVVEAARSFEFKIPVLLYQELGELPGTLVGTCTTVFCIKAHHFGDELGKPAK